MRDVCLEVAQWACLCCHQSLQRKNAAAVVLAAFVLVVLRKFIVRKR